MKSDVSRPLRDIGHPGESSDRCFSSREILDNLQQDRMGFLLI